MARLVTTLRANWAARAARGQTPATVTEPTLKAGKILTPDIDVDKAGNVPALSVTLDAGTVGVAYFTILLQAPSQTHYYYSGVGVPAYPPEPAVGTLKFQIGNPFDGGQSAFYLAPGVYTIVSACLISNDGSYITIDQPQLAAAFPSLVINATNSGTPDTAPPTAGHGKILTPSVSLGSSSPYFAIKIPVADNLSGVTDVFIDITSPGGISGSGGSGSITLPILKGSTISYVMVPAGSATGTYTISNIFISDLAGNSLIKQNPAEIKALLGALTFQVTQ